MRQLSESFYVREDNLVLLHGHGPSDTPWCVVDISVQVDNGHKIVAMFADLNDGLSLAQNKVATDPTKRILSVELQG